MFSGFVPANDADGGGPETLERQGPLLGNLHDQEAQSGGTSTIDRLDSQFDGVGSLTVPVDTMVQSQVADEDELHQKDAASVAITWSNSGVQGDGIKRPEPADTRHGHADTGAAAQPSRKRTADEASKEAKAAARKARVDAGRKRNQEKKQKLAEMSQKDRQAEQIRLLPYTEKILGQLPRIDVPPRVCRHCDVTLHGNARDQETKCCALPGDEQMSPMEEEVEEGGVEEEEVVSPAIVATAPEGSEDNPIVLD